MRESGHLQVSFPGVWAASVTATDRRCDPPSAQYLTKSVIPIEIIRILTVRCSPPTRRLRHTGGLASWITNARNSRERLRLPATPGTAQPELAAGTPPAEDSWLSPNGLPSESLQIAHRWPGWTTLPPSVWTRCSDSARSLTTKYASENESPGPRPRAWTPTAGASACVCHPSPSSSPRGPSSAPRALRPRSAEHGLGRRRETRSRTAMSRAPLAR